MNIVSLFWVHDQNQFCQRPYWYVKLSRQYWYFVFNFFSKRLTWAIPWNGSWRCTSQILILSWAQMFSLIKFNLRSQILVKIIALSFYKIILRFFLTLLKSAKTCVAKKFDQKCIRCLRKMSIFDKKLKFFYSSCLKR